MDRQQIRNAKQDIKTELAQGSFPEEVRLLHTLLTAAELLINDIDQRMRQTYARHGLIASTARYSNSMLSGMNEYCRTMTRAATLCQKFIEPMADNVHKEVGPQAYDNIQYDANEILRLVLLFKDRARDDKAYENIMECILAQPSAGVFTDSDITRFIMK